MAEPPTREFIRKMETRRPFGARRVSVLALVDDGSALAEQFARCATLPPAEAAFSLEGIVRPIVEPVLTGARCSTTGLELMDVWRYFRLTWALPYRSTPGRTFASCATQPGLGTP